MKQPFDDRIVTSVRSSVYASPAAVAPVIPRSSQVVLDPKFIAPALPPFPTFQRRGTSLAALSIVTSLANRVAIF